MYRLPHIRKYGVAFKSASVSEKYGATLWCSLHQFAKKRKTCGADDSGDEGTSSSEEESMENQVIDLESCNMRMRLSPVKGQNSYRFKPLASRLDHHHSLEHKEGVFYKTLSITVEKDHNVSIDKFVAAIKRRTRSTADLMIVYNTLRRLCHTLGVT